MKLLRSAEGIQRVILVLTTLMFLISWGELLFSVTRYWHETPTESHYWAIMFAVLYPFPWVVLVRENRSKLQMATLTYLAFFAAMKFIFP